MVTNHQTAIHILLINQGLRSNTTISTLVFISCFLQLLDYREINMQLYFPKPLFRICIFLLRFDFWVTSSPAVKPINHAFRELFKAKQRSVNCSVTLSGTFFHVVNQISHVWIFILSVNVLVHLCSKTNFRPTITWKSDSLLPCEPDSNRYLLHYVGPSIRPAIRELLFLLITVPFTVAALDF